MIPDKQVHIESMTRYLLDSDRENANKLFMDLMEKHTPEDVFKHVFDPALKHFGDIWSHDCNISLAQGFIAGKIAEDFLLKVGNLISTDKNIPSPGKVIIGNIEDDYHALGRNLIVAFLKAEGFEVLDLGNDVTAEEFLETYDKTGIPILGVSAMMFSNAMNIKKLRELIDQRGLTSTIKLVVGGAVFNQREQLLKEVGGDYTAPNAFEAVELFRKLNSES